jgi:hypothetical protein
MARHQLGGCIFQSEHKQQEDHADLAGEVCELVHAFELDQAAGPEKKAPH